MSHDPLANRRDRDAASAKKKQAEEKPLNPDFPFVRQSFDPLFYRLEKEVEQKKASTPPLPPL